MKKNLFKNTKSGEIHFGVNAPTADFVPAAKVDVQAVLKKLGSKKLWRCNVCNDLHIGMQPPKECPTCHSIDAYVEINLNELKKILEL